MGTIAVSFILGHAFALLPYFSPTLSMLPSTVFPVATALYYPPTPTHPYGTSVDCLVVDVFVVSYP